MFTPLHIVGGEQVGTRRSPGIDLEAEGTQIAEIHLLTGFQTFQHALGGGDEHWPKRRLGALCIYSLSG